MSKLESHRKHVDIIKKPIEILNLNQRFKAHFFNLCLVNSSIKDFRRNVYIEIVDNSNPENNSKHFYNNLNREQLSYIEHLQVIDYKEENISTGVLEDSSRKNSLKTGMDCYQKVYHYRLKYLPKQYVNHPFYSHGYISANIYDHLISDTTKSACTVIGTESYGKLIDYIRNRKYGNKVLKEVYEKCADEIKSNNDKFLIECMCKTCWHTSITRI